MLVTEAQFGELRITIHYKFSSLESCYGICISYGLWQRMYLEIDTLPHTLADKIIIKNWTDFQIDHSEYTVVSLQVCLLFSQFEMITSK